MTPKTLDHPLISLDPRGVYEDGQLRLLLDVTSKTMARERREKRIKFMRKGKHTFYLGQWLLNWMEGGSVDGEVALANAN